MWQLQFTTLWDSMTPSQPSRPQVSPSQYPSSLMIVCSQCNRIGQEPGAGDQTHREGGLAPANAVGVKGRGCSLDWQKTASDAPGRLVGVSGLIAAERRPGPCAAQEQARLER